MTFSWTPFCKEGLPVTNLEAVCAKKCAFPYKWTGMEDALRTVDDFQTPGCAFSLLRASLEACPATVRAFEVLTLRG